MAFCMGSRAKASLTNAKKKQGKSQLSQKGPQPPSPILQTERQIQDNFKRDQALQLMSHRKKKSFVIKTSIQQTRFSKKDIKDLKQRFEKHSSWILVDGKGNNMETENKPTETDYQSQLKVLDQEKNSTAATSLNINSSNSFNKRVSSQSPNTSAVLDKQSQNKTIMKGHFKKIEINLEEALVDHGIHYTRKMSKQQFRSCMGLLGLESNAFLSDRIFDVVDTDRDSYITFAQFATIMDTLINGEEDEKHEFSFSLLDVYDTGYFDFEEFREIIGKIVAHWCIITGSQVKIEREGLKEIFNKMDQNQDGIVDIDEYKQALKGNSQLFQWFDLLNQGIQDGKNTQKDIIDIKLNALSDVLELQTKLSKVMNQMQQTMDYPTGATPLNLQQLDYISSKQSSSQMSNFGDSAFSRQKRDSFNIEDIDKSINNRNYDQRNKHGDQIQMMMREATSPDAAYFGEKQTYSNHLNLKWLLSPERRESAYMPSIHPFPGLITDNHGVFHDFLENSTADNTLTQKLQPKKALKTDSYQYKILELKKQQDLQKLRKKEFGEKKAQISLITSKQKREDSDTDVIEDPDSPQINKNFNASNSNNARSKRVSHIDGSQMQDQSKKMQESSRKKAEHGYRSPSPLIKLQQTYLLNSNKKKKEEELKREASNNSSNSQMKPENQQSTQIYPQKNAQPQKVSRNAEQNYTRQLTHNMSIQRQDENKYLSDWSPSLTLDGMRSELNHQGGGPLLNLLYHKSVEKPLSDFTQTKPLKKIKSLHQSVIDEIVDQNSDKYQLLKQNEALKNQQQLLMNQLNDIQQLANHLLTQLQEDKDSAIGEQIKDYVEKQKTRMLKQGSMKSIRDDDSDDDEYGEDIALNQQKLQRISQDFNDGNLRPLTEIQTFFRVRSRQRLTESIKKANRIHKPLSNKKDKSFIHIGHDNWNLVLHMMLGIRQSVRNVMHEEAFELIEQDFKRKYCYELVAKKTKNMNLFEFYDFSPRVFHLIRTMYGITPEQYLKSIGPENLIGNLLMGNISSLKEQCSTGKSGSFFYYTADSNFMLKTISSGEFHNLRDILKDYYDHLAMYPHTLITRFFGLHKIKYSKGSNGLNNKVRIYFVIMANVFKTSRDINVRFDLKGSTQGRKTKITDDYVDPSVALKDLDFIEKQIKIKVSPDIQKALCQQMVDDVRIFQRLNINDYSLLLGIHYLQDEEEARQIIQSSPSIHQIIRNSFTLDNNSKLLVQYNSQKMMRPPVPFYEAHDGGIVSADGKCVYFIGIIDTLTNFGTKKKLEYRLKSVAYGNKTISCIPPKRYGERFLKFMNQIFSNE